MTQTEDDLSITALSLCINLDGVFLLDSFIYPQINITKYDKNAVEGLGKSLH